MSNVYKAQRKPSSFEVFDNAIKMRRYITEYVLTDFAIDGKLERMEKYFLNDERKELLNDIRMIVVCLTMANSIFINNKEEYEERRLWQDRAIGYCNRLNQELQYVISTLSSKINVNKYTLIEKDIKHELNLIKAWRKSENHFKTEL